MLLKVAPDISEPEGRFEWAAEHGKMRAALGRERRLNPGPIEASAIAATIHSACGRSWGEQPGPH